MSIDKVIESTVKRLHIEQYAIREVIIDFNQLRDDVSPNRRFINFSPDEIVFPYLYSVYSTSAKGVSFINFVLRSASNVQLVNSSLFMIGDLTPSPTPAYYAKFNHISAHREFLTIEYVDDSSWEFNYAGGGTVNALILKILKHT